MKKWQIENSENSEISEKLFRVFLFPSFRFCPTAKIQNSDFKISEPSFQPGRKNCDNQGRTRWYWYRRHWRLRGFTKNSVHPWKMIKVFVDGGELTKNINEKKKPCVLQAYRCPLCDKFFRRQYFFNKYVEYWESIEIALI